MEGIKEYQQPKGTIIQVINDIVELQNGKLTFSDTSRGKIFFLVRMYGNKWEFRFTANETGENRCSVSIAVEQETGGTENQIKREFALLDSMLSDGAEIEIIEQTDHDR